MEFSGQGKEIRTPVILSYGEGAHNGNSQTLDHLQQQPQAQRRGPDSDRVAGSGGSTSKTLEKSTVRYRECLRNHAASIGGSVVDGCGEFMPSGGEGSIEAFTCAACACHRNFHRKEVNGETHFVAGSRRTTLMLNPLQLPPPLPSPPALHHHHTRFPMGFVQPMNMAFGGSGGGGTESSSEELNVYQSNAEAAGPPATPFSLSKKRFRTKFTQEQKEKMLEFAEKVGWRMLKQDEEEVDRFCAEFGVKRRVLKVWMHNNKNSTKQQQQQQQQQNPEMQS